MQHSTPDGRDARAPRALRSLVVATLAAALAVAGFVAAGNWQRNRAEAREARKAQQDAADTRPAAPLPVLDPGIDLASLRYTRVRLEGEYIARGQILLDNRVVGGRVGYDVLTPIALADRRIVVVDRGFVAQGRTRAELPPAPVPTGAVVVEGRLNLPAAGESGAAPGVDPGPVWQIFEPDRYAAVTGLPVLPVIVEATSAPSPDDGLVRARAAPDFGSEKNRSYMLQWYAFAGLAIVLWLGYVVRVLRRARPARTTDA